MGGNGEMVTLQVMGTKNGGMRGKREGRKDDGEEMERD